MGRRTIGVLLTLALLAAACGTGDGGDDAGGLSVVVTTGILGDVVSNVVGDDAQVEVLIPLGADPHEFQASSAQVARIHKADLVVVNGLGLEEGLIDVLEAAAADGARVVEVAPRVDPLPFAEGDGHDHDDQHDDHADDHDDHADDHSDDHDRGSNLDPHVWMDPLRMAAASRIVATELSALQPDIDWMARADDYAARLAEADSEIQETLSVVPAGRRRLVTNHATFGYFADRYGWEVLRTVIPGGTSGGAPSSADLAELVHLIEDEGITAIFVETTQPDALARAVASEVGGEVAVVVLHTESLTASGGDADTLIDLLVTNARLITDALTRDG